jgi:hypothetical protein
LADAVGGDADVSAEDGPVLHLAHLADPLQQCLGPFHLFLCRSDSPALGERFQLLHGDEVIHHQAKETLKGVNVAVILGDFVQVKVAIFRRRELVLLHRQAGHGPHQVGRWPQPAKGVADAALAGQQAMPGRLFDELGDELVHVQVAQAHGDGHHLGP